MAHSPVHPFFGRHPVPGPRVRLGLMVAQDGSAGLWSPSAIASADLAVQELNLQGGILGREIELVTMDCGASGAIAAGNARDSLEIDGISAMIGMFPSYARADVAAAVGRRIPFLYTPQFEGGETRASVITTGETTAELLGLAVDWLVEHRRARRFFLCGSDYRWPRESFTVARRIISDCGGSVLGESFQHIGDHNYDLVLQAIADSAADTVVPMFLGLDAVAFNRAFAASGLARHVLRCAPGLDETILYGLSPEDTENLYSVAGYFASHRSANNGGWLERYHMRFGDNPPPANCYGQSAYEGIYALAALAEASGSLDPALVRRALGRTAPQRSARNGRATPAIGARPNLLLAEIDGYDIRILREGRSCRPI
ncbi:substrate-binding domain-containing protein [Pseudogemmobacter sonorensis]|uniref:substrate-binding domain-containing protein n=1 Tax=Pseudogemmobacter sonorensis TaxID=2989681 RepID=UPI0036C9F722